ncbi:cleavage stimulation factor subunit 2 tau variant isoform X2 [Bacillus rossius redtenbacheri]|uniref:cleavage stimulation factor subunit 2 tau variant isoform X2 n=1 Tax=Bacillus rossius redtenbacheri TaxID=93214 RepID=UPI002FDEE34F
MGDSNLMDKSLRSVFVGNIPYEATEEKLKDIFSEVGPVLSFKLVYDRETGKPKGYGFCEYKDQETALSAMRNLNGYEIGGRTLRVDNACTEKSRMEMQSLLQGPVVENPYGEVVQAEKAPEAISKAVASLPPEQMFELMKQMKMCVQSNPNEARAMLLRNPQLAYALLQAQVVMRIVDPHVAVTMLHKVNPTPPVLLPVDKPVVPVPLPVPVPAPAPVAVPPVLAQPAPLLREEPWPAAALPAPPLAPPAGDVDHRVGRMGDQDLRVLPTPTQAMPAVPQRDPREGFPPAAPDHFQRDPRMAPVPVSVPADRFPPRDPRGEPRERVDPRTGAAPVPVVPVRPAAPVAPVVPRPASAAGPGPLPAGMPNMSPGAPGASDQEKAALIMQVLQLSDEQIAMLPPEQRQSILVLKEQIAKSTQRQ